VPIRVILFDLDNTLLLEDQATEQALEQTSAVAAQRAGADGRIVRAAAEQAADALLRASPSFPYADAIGISWGEALWGEFGGHQAGLQALRAFVPAYRREVWTRALAAAHIEDDALAGELAAAYPSLRRALRPLDPAAEATLDDLAGTYRLGLLTNGAADLQREKLAATTLASRFAAIVISSDVGAGKPEPAIFHAALDALGCSADDAVMVGDSLERDVVGARRAGLRSVWLDRGADAAPDASAAPHARIRDLSELRRALTNLERAVAAPQLA
jgi:putative hydrolase of the HAD superfamily